MKRRLQTLALIAILLILFPTYLCASILVGTVVSPSVETIAEINQLIDDYNSDFSASLPQVQSLLDKIEGEEGADFEEGIFSLGDFDFYQQDAGGSTSLNVFDATVNFSLVDFSFDGFDDLDNPVFAFEQKSGPSFDYYVSKGGNQGWSLWLGMPGLNPSYTDEGDSGSSSSTGTGFTRGNINDNNLIYDPVNNGVSHISFYQAVPEPASWILLALVGTCFCFHLLRRGLLEKRPG